MFLLAVYKSVELQKQTVIASVHEHFTDEWTQCMSATDNDSDSDGDCHLLTGIKMLCSLL